jgi:hypothetical protein
MSRHLAIIAVALGGLAHGSPGVAQACDSDCAAILGVALERAAAEFNVPFAEIIVDTVRGGFAARRERGSALRRIIGPRDLERLRRSHGVMLGGPDAGHDCRPIHPGHHACVWLRGTALVAFTALRVEGDSATLLVRIETTPSEGRAHGRSAWLQLYLSKTSSRWRLDRAVQVGW